MKNLVAILILLIPFTSLRAQSSWEVTELVDNPSIEVEYLDSYLLFRQKEFMFDSEQRVSLPYIDGNEYEFELKRTTVTEEGIQNRYPEIKTYYGYNEDLDTKVSLTISPYGSRAIYFTPEGRLSLEPHGEDRHNYKLYRHSDLDMDLLPPICEVDHGDIEKYEHVAVKRSAELDRPLRTYRLLMGASSEFSGRFGNHVPSILNSIVTLVNAMNLTQGNEIGINYLLIDETESMIFTNEEDDPYSGMSPGEILGANTGISHTLVGEELYDIAHALSSNCTGGAAGISRGSIACSSTKRGGGITCFYGSQAYLYDVSVHEFGHHLSAGHTWSNCPGNEGQLSISTAYEIGSGYTILSYSGSCGDENVGLPDPDIYHAKSLEQMEFFHRTALGSECGELQTENINRAPEVSAALFERYDSLGETIIIPPSTPYILEGQVTDPDGDDLLFNWEQYDLGPTSTIGEPRGSSPAVIGQNLVEEPIRYLPDLSYIINGQLSRLEPYIDYSRRMTFRLTARDYVHESVPESAGATNFKEVSFLVHAEDTEPFRVLPITEDNTQQKVGNFVTVNWENGNSHLAPINCKRVDIYFSENSGEDSFDELLVANVPNDGSQVVQLPNSLTNEGRIMVRGADNIFFHVGQENIVVAEAEKPGFIARPEPYFTKVCAPDNFVISVSPEAFGGFDETMQVSLEGVPDELDFNLSTEEITVDEILSISIDASEYPDAGIYTSEIVFVSDVDTSRIPFEFEIISNDFEDLTAAFPLQDAKNVNRVPTIEWTDIPDADSYLFELSDNLEFTNLLDSFVTEESIYELDFQLDRNALYFWRITPINRCGLQESTEIFRFQTATQLCNVSKSDDTPIFITGSGLPEVTSTITVPSGGEISDLNVTVRGTHQYVSDLSAKLKSPSGKEVVLFHRKCGNLSGFNLTLDDEAATEIQCPMDDASSYIPDEALSAFDGDNAVGDWQLIIQDNVSGSGGELKSWNLEFCADAGSPTNPSSIGDTVFVKKGGLQSLHYGIEATHPNYNLSELEVQILTTPQKGELLLDGEPFELGQKVSMAKVMNWDFVYRHFGEDEETDRLQYAVFSPDGGATGILEVPIVVNDIRSETIDYEKGVKMVLSPNPSSGEVNIYLNRNVNGGKGIIYDMHGNQLKEFNLNSTENRLNLSHLNSGTYIVRYLSSAGTDSEKLVIH